MAVREQTRAEAGPDEATVAVARKQFRRRQRSRRLRAASLRARPWLVVGILVVLLGTGVWLVWFSSVMDVTRVKVSGTDQLPTARVVRVARVPEGGPLARVDLAAIQARVENLPAVRAADVSRAWPHTVSIQVTERVPVAVVDRGAGLQAVDEQGVLFRGYPRRPPGLPLIRTASDVRAEALAEAARVIASLPTAVASKVDHLNVRTVDRIELELRDGRTVLWGSAEESTQKAEVLAVLLQRPGRHFDVSVPARPTSR